MTKTIFCRAFLMTALSVTMVVSLCPAQVITGVVPFGSYGGGPFDSVNLASLNAHFEIPVVNKAGRGIPFTYSLKYDSSIWYPVTANGTQIWTPVTNFGWPAQTELALGKIYSTSGTTHCYDPDTNGTITSTHWFYSGFKDSSGTMHRFTLATSDGACNQNNEQGSEIARDGSGYTLIANTDSAYVTSRTGWGIFPNVNPAAPGPYLVDTNGNEISVNINTGVYTDTLGTTALTVTGVGTAASPLRFQYTNPGGGQSAVVANYTNFQIKTNFGCSGVSEANYTNVPLVTSIVMPDGGNYSITYEPTPGYTGYFTGRIHSITLPTGGLIQYDYTGSNNGIVCADGSASGLTRTLTPGGQWTYARSQVSGAQWTTTVTDPQSNQTKLNFQGLYETSRASYQGSVGTTLLQTIVTCYNGNGQTLTNCDTTAVTEPVLPVSVTRQLPGGLQSKMTYSSNNGYGLLSTVTESDFGTGAPGSQIRSTVVSYDGWGGTSVGYVFRPGTVVIESPTVAYAAWTTYTYDEGTPTTTTGTPQLGAPAVVRGNPTTITQCITSDQFGCTGTSLSSHYTYYDTGNPKTASDVNGATTTYSYGTGSCGHSFPTSIGEPLSLSRSITWNCSGGLVTQVTDENGSNIAATYADPNFWRPTKVSDQLNNQIILSYSGQTAIEAALQNFNGGNSVSDSRTTVDAFGRPILGQQLQGPGAANYDTVETDYDNMGRPVRSTMPFSAVAGGTSSTAPGIVATYDALGRPRTVTDGAGGQVSYAYIDNDVLQTTSGNQTFQKQFEYDGAGRLKSVCEITTASGSGSCGQTNPANGFLTKYTYNALNRLLTVTQNAQPGAIGGAQTRSFAYDILGRMTSESNPETGTITYKYDTDSTCGTSNGDLVKRVDGAGNITCYSYDALHRVIQSGNTSVANTTLRKFFYDSKSSYPTGVTVVNGKTQLVEAQTFNTSNLSSIVTDEFFSYSKRGELTDVYQSTPHSGGYYHTSASYWATGALQSLSGVPGVPAINYGANGAGLDGEGRYTQVTAASGTNPATSVAYSTSSTINSLGALVGVTFGSADSDSFSYDPNTGRLTAYSFSVNSKTDSGTLNWNPNGTLQRLTILDNITGTSDTQTCNYFYDDLGRLGGRNANGYSVDCGAKWQQLFTFDAFGNIAKSGSSSFLPTYSTATNRFASIPGVTVQYDANGNLLTDNLNTYTWDKNWGNPASVNGTNLVYDALGRMVEKQNGSTYTEILYSPVGKTALMNGQTLSKAFIGLPGGATAIYNSTGLAYYRHSDWLGSSRLTSTQARGLYSSSAYAPFGEQYAVSGTADASFTGQNSDTASTLYDFTFRENSPSQGRWLSPDPAGLVAADLTNPQSWNRYAYVLNNPLSFIDLLGLDCVYLNDSGTAPEVIDHNSSEGECGSTGGYWIEGSVNDASWVSVDADRGLVSSYGVTWDGFIEFSIAGAMGSNIFGAWTQTFVSGTTTTIDVTSAADGGANQFGIKVINEVARETAGFTKAANCAALAATSNIPMVNSLAGAPSYKGVTGIPVYGAISAQASKGQYSLSIVNNPGPSFSGNFPAIAEKAAPFVEKVAVPLAVVNSAAVAYQCYRDPNN